MINIKAEIEVKGERAKPSPQPDLHNSINKNSCHQLYEKTGQAGIPGKLYVVKQMKYSMLWPVELDKS
jgi:hypothetical protein